MEDILALEKDVGRPSLAVHIRVQQRNNKKCWTLIEGLPPDTNWKIALRGLKKTLSTNGTVVTTETGQVIQIQGDHRKAAAEFLTKFKLCEEQDVHIHGA